jgi:hypothetical protein
MSMEFKRLPSPPPVTPATREQVFEFLRGLQEFRRKGQKPLDEQAIKDYLNRQPLGSLQGVARRIMMDILKSPTADPSPSKPGKGARKRKIPAKKQARPAGRKSGRTSKKSSKKSPRAAAKRGAASKKKAAGRKAPKKKASKKR